jgi:FHA domain
MSLKQILDLLKKLLGFISVDPGPPVTSGGKMKCQNGHVMDPSWKVCPYCEAAQGAQQKTVHAPSNTGQIASANAPRTRVGEAIAASGRVTHVETNDAVDDLVTGKGVTMDSRKICGVLITYSWRREGELHAIREGKNYIGSGNVESEGGRPCDIQVSGDGGMSKEHALILSRGGRIEIVDQKSTNATFLNDVLVPLNGMELPDVAKIKTGNTIWTFMKIPTEIEAETMEAPRDPLPNETRPRGPKDPTMVR